MKANHHLSIFPPSFNPPMIPTQKMGKPMKKIIKTNHKTSHNNWMEWTDDMAIKKTHSLRLSSSATHPRRYP